MTAVVPFDGDAPTKQMSKLLRGLFLLPKRKANKSALTPKTLPKEYEKRYGMPDEHEAETEDHVSNKTLPIFQPLELPIDIRSSPFSKSTFTPTVSKLAQLQSLQDAKHESMEPFRLLDLPVELRLQVLTHHLSSFRTVPVTFDGAIHVKSRHWYVYGLATERRNSMSILRTCRQLHDEASDVLWDSTTFVIQVKDQPGEIPRTLKEQISIHMGRGLSFERMRHAIFHVDAASLDCEGATLDALLEKLKGGKGLKTAELHFDFGDRGSPGLDDWIFGQFLELPVDRLEKLSCVRARLLEHGRWTCVPYNEHLGFRRLLEKFQALDVSVEECGGRMLLLVGGQFGELDVRILGRR